MDKEEFLYRNDPARVIFVGPSECSKSVFLNKLNFK